MAVVAVLAVTAGCTSSDAPAAETGLGPGVPSVGACRLLTTADITPSSNETPVVPCSKPHTSVTIAVGGFRPGQVTDRNLTDGTLGNLALQRCTAAWKRTVGGSTTAQHTSLLGVAYYLPDQTQLSNGARWYRCDVVLGGQDGLPLQDLPPRVDGLLDGSAVPDSVRACRTTPEFTSGHAVPCVRDHVLRAVGTFALSGGAAYPGKAALSAASAKGCTGVINRWLHGRENGGDAYQWPDQVGWTLLDDHTATCWTVTTD
jgi:Septum formation